MGTSCPKETADLKDLFNNMQTKVKSKFEAKESQELIVWEKEQLAQFCREKEKFGEHYLTGLFCSLVGLFCLYLRSLLTLRRIT
jgi:hypothetical protein